LQYTLLEKKYNTKDDCADEKKILKNKIKIKIKVPRTEAKAFDIHFVAVKQFPHIASIFNNLRAVFHLAKAPPPVTFTQARRSLTSSTRCCCQK